MKLAREILFVAGWLMTVGGVAAMHWPTALVVAGVTLGGGACYAIYNQPKGQP